MIMEVKNVLGTKLNICCLSPVTGFYRNGRCDTGSEDLGMHTVCAQVTAEFLEFSQKRGNDLSTPVPGYDFPGLQPGDRWCLCVLRWKEALEAGVAPPIILEACHESVLQYVPLEKLQEFSLVEN